MAQTSWLPDHKTKPEQAEKILLTRFDSLFSSDMEMLSLYKREETLMKELQYALDDSASFNYDFPELTKRCHGLLQSSVEIYSSDDLHLRAFTWRSPASDSLHHFTTIFQAKNQVGDVVVAIRKPAKEYSKFQYLFRLNDVNRQLYLAIGKGQNSPSFVYQTVEIIEVMDRYIADVTDEFLPAGQCVFQILSPHSATVRKETMPEAVFDRRNQVLSCPEKISGEGVAEKNDWTGRIIRFHFNKGKFEAINW